MNELQHILKLCLKADRNSQRMLYEHYYGYVLKIAFRYMEDYQNAVLVANDAFVKAFNSLKQFDTNDTEQIVEMRFKGWLRRITVNTALDQLRMNKRVVVFETIEENHWTISDENAQTDGKYLYKELICYLKELPPAYQKVFNLYVIDGYSHAEIAELLEISIGSSKSNLFRAKEFLQKRIGEFFEINKA